jgi:O-antigen/teichoic acid export membrane protein
LLASLVATVLILILNLVASRIVVHRLLSVEYGAWIVMSSFAAYTALLDLGISTALVRVIASERVLEKRTLSQLGVAIRTYLVLGVAGFLLVAVGGLAYLGSRGIDVRPGTDVFAADMVLAVGALISLPGSVFSAYLAGHERYGAVNAIAAGSAFVSTVTIILLFLSHGSLIAIATITVLVGVAATLARIILAARIDPHLWSELRRGGSFKDFGELLLLSIGFFVQGIAVMMIWRLDPLVVGAGVSIAAVTTYSLAQRLATSYSDVGAPIFFSAMPSIARTYAGGQHDQVRNALIILTRAALLTALPITIILAVESRSLMTIWVGSPYDSDWLVAAVLIVAVGISIVRNPSLVALQATYSVRTLAWFHILEGGSNLALSIALVLPLHQMGVAIGTAVPSIAFSVFAYLRTAMRHMKLTSAGLFGSVSVRALVAAALASPWLLVTFPYGPVALVVVHATLFVLTYATVLGVLTPRRDRDTARQLAGRVLRAAILPGGN